MKLGLHYWTYSTPTDPAQIASTLGETAKIAEQAGFSSFTLMDHYWWCGGIAHTQQRYAGNPAVPPDDFWARLARAGLSGPG